MGLYEQLDCMSEVLAKKLAMLWSDMLRRGEGQDRQFSSRHVIELLAHVLQAPGQNRRRGGAKVWDGSWGRGCASRVVLPGVGRRLVGLLVGVLG